jgi:hypothetical protein
MRLAPLVYVMARRRRMTSLEQTLPSNERARVSLLLRAQSVPRPSGAHRS